MTGALEIAKQITSLLEITASPFYYTFSLFHVLGFPQVSGTVGLGILHLGWEPGVLT